ncbi:hypothetical protein FHG87_018695, partial [Trinorchestia longiramus]
ESTSWFLRVPPGSRENHLVPGSHFCEVKTNKTKIVHDPESVRVPPGRPSRTTSGTRTTANWHTPSLTPLTLTPPTLTPPTLTPPTLTPPTLTPPTVTPPTLTPPTLTPPTLTFNCCSLRKVEHNTTPTQHNTNTTPAQHQHNTSTTPTQHQHNTSTTPTQHQYNTSTTPAQHQYNTSTTPAQHQHNTNITPGQHQYNTNTTQHNTCTAEGWVVQVLVY